MSILCIAAINGNVLINLRYSYWSRCIADAKPAVQHRFKETLAQFFESVNLQARDRDANTIPDLESFIDIRRDTSGCKSVFDLVEYAMDIELPDEVLDHPVIAALKQGSNDLVTWSNVSNHSVLFIMPSS